MTTDLGARPAAAKKPRKAPAKRATGPVPPTMRHERSMLDSGARFVAGMDEVGRGALAGPVSVGVVVVDLTTGAFPEGLTDSKMLTPSASGGSPGRSVMPAPRRSTPTGSWSRSGSPVAVRSPRSAVRSGPSTPCCSTASTTG